MYLIAIIHVCIIHCIKKEPLTQVIGYHPFLEKMDPPPNLHHLRCYLSDKIIYGVACQPDK